jgi:small multidrug resistance pump
MCSGKPVNCHPVRGCPTRACRPIAGVANSKGSAVSFVYLGIAIVAEVIATSALKASDGFTRPLATVITTAGYATAFYFLSLTLKTIPVGIAYAIWSGVGIVLISVIGFVWFRQSLDLPAVIGLTLIVAGVVVINMYSQTMPH